MFFKRFFCTVYSVHLPPTPSPCLPPLAHRPPCLAGLPRSYEAVHRPLRGIFRKRRALLDHLFRVSLGTLRDWMRAHLSLPAGELAAIASVQTFGDYLNFHPHLHVLAASGLVDREGRFHLLPVEKRRGIGGVLDAGEAGARRVSPPGGAGESNMEPLDVPEHWGWSDA